MEGVVEVNYRLVDGFRNFGYPARSHDVSRKPFGSRLRIKWRSSCASVSQCGDERPLSRTSSTAGALITVQRGRFRG